MAYSTELYENARREMERRRTIAEQELDRRRSELFEKCPEAQSIEENLTKISVAAGRAVLSKLENERFYSRGEQRSSTEQLLCECDLLILDDLGTEFSTKFSVAEIYNILNTRMMSSLPTIISTNLTLARIQEQYGSRLVSRVIGGLDRVELIGTDVRQLKRRERKNSK